MKKVIKLVLVLVGILLVFEFFFFIFKNHHEVNYTRKSDDIKYKINEVYEDGKYYLKIVNKDKVYSFEVNDNFFKRKRIVKKIYDYKGKDFFCIYPKFKDEKIKYNIVCSKNYKTYSYEYYKDKLGEFTKYLKKEGFSNSSWNTKSNKQNKIDTLTIYPNRIMDDTYIYIYNYKGFYSINKKEQFDLRILKNDHYKNTLGDQVEKYYLMANYDQSHDYSEFYRINMTNNKVKKIKLKKKISTDSYINGVIDDEMYIFDRDNLKQYKINPKKKKQKEVGNKEDGVLTYKLGFERVNAYTMRDNENKFDTLDSYVSKIEKNTNLRFIGKGTKSYYYQTSNNDVYYYNSISKVKVLLFNIEISDFKVINDNIYFISDDSLYYYNTSTDLNKIVIYSELSFNPDNRIAIYME